MNRRNRRVGFLVLSSAVAVLLVYLASGQSGPRYGRKSLTLTTNDVVFVNARKGAAALIQFTWFGPRKDTATGYVAIAAYRARYFGTNAQPINYTNSVIESYRSRAVSKTEFSLSERADHYPYLKFQDFTLEWSYGSDTNGWLYYNTNQVAVRLLPADAFEKPPPKI